MISDDIRRFILNNIPSVPCLEALLLLNSLPDHQWDTAELAKRLFIKESATEALIQQLHKAELIKTINEKPLLFQYHVKDEERKQLINQLAATYTANLIEITNLIHSNIDKRAQKFSDSFIWRKD